MPGRNRQYSASGERFRIRGHCHCLSACTMFHPQCLQRTRRTVLFHAGGNGNYRVWLSGPVPLALSDALSSAGAVGAATGTLVVRGTAAPVVLDGSGPIWEPARDQIMRKMASPTIMTGTSIA
jgi:hypothetical protein